jgi:chemotaxis methyl-accepting protein methylase
MTKLFVVGIGASAGGFEALKPLLKNLKKTGRFVFIIAQHMHSGAHTELMAKLLAVESALTVSIGVDGEVLKPDQIYLIPAGYDGFVEGGKLHLAPPSKLSYTKPSVNILFNSIATEYHSRCAGIVLSGVGVDGAKGCLAIQSKGGLTMAQQPADAQFDGMPAEAIRMGAVQHVVMPEKMGALLVSLLQESNVIALQGTAPILNLNGRQLETLTQMVLGITGVDFTSYKQETLVRRINARMAYLNLNAVDDYIEFCVSHPDEIQSLQQTFLVSTSHFFRDPLSFKALEPMLEELVSKKTSADTIQILVPACATGEECYSLAIMFCEIFKRREQNPSLNIIGCDLNIRAIHKAKEAWYPPSALKQIDPTLLDKYFTKEGDVYRVNHKLRSYCQFDQSDIFKITTEKHFDMISCRNLLIYLNTDLQNLLLKSFYHQLSHDGLLFVGQSESISESAGRYFKVLSYLHKIFRRR